METVKLSNLATNLVRGKSEIALDFQNLPDADAALHLYELYFAFWARQFEAPYLEIRVQGKRLTTVSANLTPQMFGLSSLPELPEDKPEQPTRAAAGDAQISSWGSETIRPSAEYEEILDFVKGRKLDGYIVTITSMVDDKCLMVNDLQALDRGGGWTAQNWIGIDFKTLWKDSFQLGRRNYYGELRDRVATEKRVTEFIYQIRRPSGALAEYSSNYHYVENFLGGAVRIAVSRPGDWSIVEPSPSGSAD